MLRLARELGVPRVGRVAIDGSKVQANASKHKAMSYGRMREKTTQLREEAMPAGATFENSRGLRTDFSTAHMVAANFSGARCERCTFIDASIFGADFSNASLRGCSMRRARLRFASFLNAALRDTTFDSADLEYAKFSGADVSGTTFRSANISKAEFDVIPSDVHEDDPAATAEYHRGIRDQEALTILFDSSLEAHAVEECLRALSDYFRACGGAGLRVQMEPRAYQAVGPMSHA